MSENPASVVYAPAVFEVDSIEQAKRVILTAEDTTTEDRWRIETPYLADEIDAFLQPDAKSLIVDYGCGIGRMSKELIARHDCSVLGVDISQSMRQLAPGYVDDPRFAVSPRPAFKAMADWGMRADAAIAIWSLQHCAKPQDDIAMINHALKPGAGLFVCNTHHTAVPTSAGWADVGGDVRSLLADTFEEVDHAAIAAEYTTDLIARMAYLGKYQKRG